MDYVYHGGGIKGVCHIGVLKAIEEENMQIDIISGTSSGSIVAALIAAGYTSEEIYLLFKKYAKKITQIDIKNIIKLIYGILIRRKIIIKGLNDGNKLEKIINKKLKEKNIEKISETKIPLIIPSVSLKNGELYYFSSQSINNKRIKISDKIVYINDIAISKAVKASCSYPLVFEPCKYKENEFIDGGIRENTPWKEIKKQGVKKVISVVFETEIDGKNCKNAIDVVSTALSIMNHELKNYELEGADYLIKIPIRGISLLDTNKIEELYKIGYKIGKKEIKKIKETF